jgi:transposase
MLHLSNHTHYYFYNMVVDMRKGVYGLCGIVNNELRKNVMTGDVFVFLNKRHNQIKLLQWDKDGFAMYEKKLEKGTYEIPKSNTEDNNILLNNIQLQHILQGVILQSVKHKIRYNSKA